MNYEEIVKAFIPNSAGNKDDKLNFGKRSSKHYSINLLELASAFKTPIIDIINQQEVFQDFSEELKNLFNKYGSDKSNGHDYQYIYSHILKDKENIKNIVEIGMGTNNIDVVSNMGRSGKPGASLRAFRDYLPNANIFGGDVDKGILFEEERIKSFFVDQLDFASVYNFFLNIPNDVDLIIDDGLHNPEANLNIISHSIAKIKIGGWILIEDIDDEAINVWKVISLLIPNNYNKYLLKSQKDNIFAIQKTGD